jgi:hypothetical protein
VPTSLQDRRLRYGVPHRNDAWIGLAGSRLRHDVHAMIGFSFAMHHIAAYRQAGDTPPRRIAARVVRNQGLRLRWGHSLLQIEVARNGFIEHPLVSLVG